MTAAAPARRGDGFKWIGGYKVSASRERARLFVRVPPFAGTTEPVSSVLSIGFGLRSKVNGTAVTLDPSSITGVVSAQPSAAANANEASAITGNDRLVVITHRPSFSIPQAVGSYALVHGASYSWVVTTHGTQASVDDMAGANGFIDSFGYYTVDLEPTGPSHADGSYTASLRKSITAK